MKTDPQDLTYSLTFKEVVDILKIIDDSACRELELEIGNFKLRVIRGHRRIPTAPAVGSAGFGEKENLESTYCSGEMGKVERFSQGAASSQGQKRIWPAVGGGAASSIPAGIALTAPLTGTFYRAPAPGAPPFVEVGNSVEIGDPVAIIEVMKLMNIVKATHRGVIREICAENETMIQFGHPLMYIDPSNLR